MYKISLRIELYYIYIRIWIIKIILRYKYKMKPNEDGSYDMETSPGFKDAVLIKTDE
jgi:hypothetical protein